MHTAMPKGIVGFVFLLIILGSAWWGGYVPGVLATILTLTAVPYAIVPGFKISKVDGAQVVLVTAIAVLVSRVAQGRNEREAVLDQRVRRRTEDLERAMASLQERESLLLKQADELSRSNADLQQFAYVASHDLQEPLRQVAIYSELFRKRYGTHVDAEANQFLCVIEDGVRRMETLIRDLLSYSRAIHGDVPSDPQEVDVQETVRMAEANLAAAIEETSAKIEYHDLPTIRAHRIELAQIFQNLLSNALKYRGADPPRIAVRAARGAVEWTFCVRDNGIGIHPDYHENIFQPFKRLHGREYPGTGIGLALCRRIVERESGRIWVESEPGRGASFFFTIPHAAPNSTEAGTELSSASGR